MYAEEGDMTPKGELSFDTSKARQYSRLGEAPRIVEDGYVEKFLSQWMKKWKDDGQEKVQQTHKLSAEKEDVSQEAGNVRNTSAPEAPDLTMQKRKRQAEEPGPNAGPPRAKRSMTAAVAEVGR